MLLPLRRCLAALVSSFLAVTTAAQVPAQPNVLFVYIDDLNYDLGAFGHPVVQTPNLDALAQRGVRFSNNYCPVAVCGPSRIATMLGMRSSTTALTQNLSGELVQPQFRGVPILPKLFHDAGYTTAGTGKIFHNNQVHPDTWDHYAPPWWHDTNVAFPAHPAPEHGHRTIYGGPFMNGANGQLGRLVDTKSSDYAIQMIATLPTPWFVEVGYVAPHSPYFYPEAYETLYDPAVDVPPLPPQEAGPWRNGMAAEVYNSDTYLDPAWGATEDERRRRATVAYWRTITFVDHEIGRLLAQLNASGRESDTIVVVLSDHGWTMGQHSRYNKLSTFESDAKSPLIVAVPWETSSAGQVCSHPVEHIDLYPTLADYCHLPSPIGLDGESLRPQLRNPETATDAVYCIATLDWESRWQRMVRTDLYKLIYHESGNQTRRHMFFDLQNDPGEYVNLYEDPAYATLVASHEQLLFAKGLLQAGWSNYQYGRAGELGVPTLELSAPPVLGTTVDLLIGNSSSSPTLAALITGWWGSRNEGPAVAGGPMLVHPWIVTTNVIPPGVWSSPFAVPSFSGFIGSTLRMQVAEFDPASTSGVSWSRGMRMFIMPF